MTIRLIAAVACLFLVTETFAYAGEAKSFHEQDRLIKIVQNLQLRQPYPGEKVDKEQRKFCRAFLEDLKANRGIEFVEPILRTDEYNDPKLQAYLSKCPKLELNKSISFNGRIAGYAETLPEEEREKIGTVWYTTVDFKLYHIDIDNNPKNGKEYVFYGAGSYSPNLPKKGLQGEFAVYSVVDFRDCRVRDSVIVGDTVRHLTKQSTGNHNGIIKYRAKYYIYDLQHFGMEDSYSMRLYGWRSRNNKMLLSCKTFIENKTKRKGDEQ